MTIDVAIIGGGVSGLAAAHGLRRRGYSAVVLERQARAGGNAVSQRRDGFLMEHGPSTVASTADDVLRLSQELGLEGDRCAMGDGVQRRYLVDGGRLRGIPVGPLGFLKSGYLSLPGRLRLMAEVLVPRGRADTEETVAQFCARRFGSEFSERVMDPLVAGIYAGRAAELSVSAVFPKLVALEKRYGSITRGMVLRARAGGRMPGSRFFSWREGVGTLPAALTADLGGAVRTGVAVRRLTRAGARLQVDTAHGTLSVRAVVVATQPHVAAQLLDGLDADAAAAACEIAAPPMAVVFLGYKRRDVDHPLNGLGFLTAESEGRMLNGAQFTSTMFANRAPDDRVSVTCYFGGARRPELAMRPSAELIDLAGKELADLIGARRPPLVARVRHWPRGLPLYGPGHGRRVAALAALSERQPGLFVTGNHLVGISVEACVQLAGQTAGRVAEFLDQQQAGARQSQSKIAAPS